MIWALPETTGLTALTPLTPAIAVASDAFSVVVEPAPAATPPLLLLPGMMVRTLVPRPDNCEATEALAPSPSATIAMTAATPMMMPSVVSKLRPLFARSAARAEGIAWVMRSWPPVWGGVSASSEKGSLVMVGVESFFRDSDIGLRGDPRSAAGAEDAARPAGRGRARGAGFGAAGCAGDDHVARLQARHNLGAGAIRNAGLDGDRCADAVLQDVDGRRFAGVGED